MLGLGSGSLGPVLPGSSWLAAGRFWSGSGLLGWLFWEGLTGSWVRPLTWPFNDLS